MYPQWKPPRGGGDVVSPLWCMPRSGVHHCGYGAVVISVECCGSREFLLPLPKTIEIMSKVVSLHHVVINTKNRHMTINVEHAEDMYRFITSIVKRNECFLCRIGGIENHIHMLVDLAPTVSLSHLVWDIKRSSSEWAKRCGLFPEFVGWGKEYGAFSVSNSHRDAVIRYIIGQREHHKQVNYDDEYRRLAERNGVEWDDNMLT